MNAILLRQAFRLSSRKANVPTFQPTHSQRNALASAWRTVNRSAGFHSSSVSRQQFLNASPEVSRLPFHPISLFLTDRPLTYTCISSTLIAIRRSYFERRLSRFSRFLRRVESTQPVTCVTVSSCGFSWCGPCKMLSPILEKLTDESANFRSGSGREVDLVTIDTDTHGELAAKYQVRRNDILLHFI